MSIHASSDQGGTTRRRFLGYVIAAPTVITAAKWAGPLGDAAIADPLPSIGVQSAESYDLIDFLRDAARPTADLIQVETLPWGEDDFRVRFELHRTEVGQGINTAIAQIIAEEMRIPIEKVIIDYADARPELLYNQLTGGSNSIYTIYDPVRTAAAVARQRFLGAAAIQLGEAASRLGVVDGQVRTPDGASIGFGELIRDAASDVTEEVEVELDQAPNPAFAYIGRPTNRIDALDIVTGAQRYTLDLSPTAADGTVLAPVATMVARPPTIDGTPETFDRDAILAMPGVSHCEAVEFGVAIGADTFGSCIDALVAIGEAQIAGTPLITWADGPAVGMDDATVQAELASAELPVPPPAPGQQVVDYVATFANQPNCPLETNPSIADVRVDASGAPVSAELWGPMKTPLTAKQDIAEALGLTGGLYTDAVTVHVVQGGGSFGRDLFWDAAREAALTSAAFGARAGRSVPVKLAYTRTDDFRQGRIHPASRSHIQISHDGTDITSFVQHHTSVNTDYGHGLGEIFTRKFDELPAGVGGNGFSQSVWYLTQYVPYDFGVVNQALAETLPAPFQDVETNIFRTSSMRNIYSPNTVTAREVALDEFCRQTGQDPAEFRLRTLKDARSTRVLEKVLEASGFTAEVRDGRAMGIGFHSEYKGRAACVAEIDVTRPLFDIENDTDGIPFYAYLGPRITRAWYAVDVGRCINPRGLEAQMMGGMMDGFANALSYSLHLRDGAWEEDSWEHAYYTRQWSTPFETKVFILDSGSQPGGAGEFGVAASMAAAANALVRATGRLQTSWPFNHDADLSPIRSNLVPQGAIPQSPTDGVPAGDERA